jgi:hypothetical protein
VPLTPPAFQTSAGTPSFRSSSSSTPSPYTYLSTPSSAGPPTPDFTTPPFQLQFGWADTVVQGPLHPDMGVPEFQLTQLADDFLLDATKMEDLGASQYPFTIVPPTLPQPQPAMQSVDRSATFQQASSESGQGTTYNSRAFELLVSSDEISAYSLAHSTAAGVPEYPAATLQSTGIPFDKSNALGQHAQQDTLHLPPPPISQERWSMPRQFEDNTPYATWNSFNVLQAALSSSFHPVADLPLVLFRVSRRPQTLRSLQGTWMIF